MDEPSEGLSPMLVLQIEKIMKNLREEGRAVLLVEQNFGLPCRRRTRCISSLPGRSFTMGLQKSWFASPKFSIANWGFRLIPLLATSRGKFEATRKGSPKRWVRTKLQMQGAQKIIIVGAIHESPLRVRCNDEVEAQRRRWTFYETIENIYFLSA